MSENQVAPADTRPTPPLLVNGNPIPFADLKPALADLAPEELLRGLRLDQNNRWQLGQPVRVEDYFQAFPILTYDPDCMIVLIFGEVMVRLQLGDEPALADYQHRFPELGDRLAKLFQLRQAPPDLDNHTAIAPTRRATARPTDGTAHLQPTVPGYEIVGALGRGGMGVVYKAKQLSLNRIVAIKMILAGTSARPDELAGFRREAELAARTHHPNVVQVFEVSAQAGHAFLAMEYVDGGHLAQKIGGQPQDPRWASRIVETLALAVHEAHRKNIIHRDLKPSNILLTAEGQIPKIADFGLAHLVTNDNQLSTATAYLGTPCYMAPEQADGRAKDIGPCTDIYALGAILYELLTGQPPFRGPTPWETINQIRTSEPVPPSQSQPGIPRDLDTICLKCLEKSPARRYASAAALADDLRRYRQGEPISARPVRTWERTMRWCLRNPGWAALIITSAVLLTVIAAGAIFSNARLEAELARTQAAKEQAEDAEWRAKINEATALRTSQRPGQHFQTLRVLHEALDLGRRLPLAPDMHVLRDQWATTLAVPDLFPGYHWHGYPSDSYGVAFDESLTLYVRTDTHGNASLRRVVGDEEVLHIPAPTEPGLAGSQAIPVLSDDGRFLALRFDNGLLQLYELKGQRADLVLSAKDVHQADFPHQGDSLVLAHRDGALSWYERTTGKLKNRVPARGFPEPSVQLHPTEPLAAIWSFRGPDAEVRDLRTGRTLGFLSSGVFPFAGLAWLADGNTLAASIPGGIVFHDRAYQYKNNRMLPTTLGPAQLVASPTGDLLVAVGANSEIHLLNVGTGQTLFRMPPTSKPLQRLRFNKDGTKLAAGISAQQLLLWDVAQGDAQRLLSTSQLPPPNRYVSATVSPKLPRLLAVGMEYGFGFLDLDSGRELAFAKDKRAQRLLFHRSGDLLSCGPDGAFRWPVRMVEGDLQIGPPDPLSHALNPSDLAVSRDGQVVAISSWKVNASAGGVWVQPAKQPPEVLDKGENVRHVGVSPDGRWLAWGLEGQTTVKIWDVKNAVVAHIFQTSGNLPSFSADGTWLAISGDKGGLFKVGDWEPGLSFSGLGAFTDDGKTLAVDIGTGTLRLVDIATGKEYGRLEDPSLAVADAIRFLANDTQLFTLNNGPQPGLRIWDLRLIRSRLAAAGLDWDLPPYPLAETLKRPALPRVVIEAGPG